MVEKPALRAVARKPGALWDESEFPFSVPAIHALERLELGGPVTFFVGENLLVGGAVVATVTAPATRITLLPGGRVDRPPLRQRAPDWDRERRRRCHPHPCPESGHEDQSRRDGLQRM